MKYMVCENCPCNYDNYCNLGYNILYENTNSDEGYLFISDNCKLISINMKDKVWKPERKEFEIIPKPYKEPSPSSVSWFNSILERFLKPSIFNILKKEKEIIK